MLSSSLAPRKYKFALGERLASRDVQNPPIVEAVAAFRFAPDVVWSDEVFDRVRTDLTEIYGGPVRQEVQVYLEARFQDGDATTSTNQVPHRVLLQSHDQSGLVGLAKGTVSVHVLKPYPGWREFQRRIEEALAVVRRHAIDVRVVEVAVRYIDRIALPSGVIPDLAAYFTAIPKRPSRMPTALSSFQSIVEAQDPETGTVVVLTTSAVPPGDAESFVMMYDLNLVQPYRAEDALPVEHAMSVLERLHDLQYDIFIDSITPRAKALFQ